MSQVSSANSGALKLDIVPDDDGFELGVDAVSDDGSVDSAAQGQLKRYTVVHCGNSSFVVTLSKNGRNAACSEAQWEAIAQQFEESVYKTAPQPEDRNQPRNPDLVKNLKMSFSEDGTLTKATVRVVNSDAKSKHKTIRHEITGALKIQPLPLAAPGNPAPPQQLSIADNFRNIIKSNHFEFNAPVADDNDSVYSNNELAPEVNEIQGRRRHHHPVQHGQDGPPSPIPESVIADEADELNAEALSQYDDADQADQNRGLN